MKDQLETKRPKISHGLILYLSGHASKEPGVKFQGTLAFERIYDIWLEELNAKIGPKNKDTTQKLIILAFFEACRSARAIEVLKGKLR